MPSLISCLVIIIFYLTWSTIAKFLMGNVKKYAQNSLQALAE